MDSGRLQRKSSTRRYRIASACNAGNEPGSGISETGNNNAVQEDYRGTQRSPICCGQKCSFQPGRSGSKKISIACHSRSDA